MMATVNAPICRRANRQDMGVLSFLLGATRARAGSGVGSTGVE